MAIGHMGRGNRPWINNNDDFTFDSADWNAWWDDLITCLESRWETYHQFAQHTDGAVATAWELRFNAAPALLYLETPAGLAPNAEEMLIPIIGKAGQLITDIRALWADRSVNGGEIKLYKRQHEVASGLGVFGDMNAETMVNDIGGNNPWNKGGALAVYSAQSGLKIELDPNYDYYVKVVASVGAPATPERFFYLKMKSSFYTP